MISYTPPPGLVIGDLTVPGTLTVTGPITTAGTVNAGVVIASGSISGASLSVSGTIVGTALALAGTLGKWAFGTAALTSGVGTIPTGLGTVLSAGAYPLGANIGLGTISSLQADFSLASSGSVIFRGLAAGVVFSANATVAWHAFGR